jgi:HTH domain.
MEKTAKILHILEMASRPVSIQELADSSGFDAHEVDKAIKRLKEEGKVTSTRNSYWTLIK